MNNDSVKIKIYIKIKSVLQFKDKFLYFKDFKGKLWRHLENFLNL